MYTRLLCMLTLAVLVSRAKYAEITCLVHQYYLWFIVQFWMHRSSKKNQNPIFSHSSLRFWSIRNVLTVIVLLQPWYFNQNLIAMTHDLSKCVHLQLFVGWWTLMFRRLYNMCWQHFFFRIDLSFPLILVHVLVQREYMWACVCIMMDDWRVTQLRLGLPR